MKKTLCILLALMCLLSLGGMNAHAQAADTSVAYLPLLPGSGHLLNAHGQFEARQAFMRMLPGLVEAQASGQIVRFSPDLADGLALVEYPTGTDLSGLVQNGLPVIDSTEAMQGFIRSQSVQATQGLRDIPEAQGLGDPSIDLQPYSSCFSLYNLGANKTYSAYLWDTRGKLVAGLKGTLDASGSGGDCLLSGFTSGLLSGSNNGMVPGFIFNLLQYDSTHTILENTYTTKIPTIEVSNYTTAQHIARGKAPVGSQLNLTLAHFQMDAGDSIVVTLKNPTTNGQGVWQADFSPSGMRGGDMLSMLWAKPATLFVFHRVLSVPFVSCILDSNFCIVFGGKAGTPADITALHGGVNYKASGYFDSNGVFSATLYNNKAVPLNLAKGDLISGSALTTLALPNLTAFFNYGTSIMSGKTPPNNGRYYAVSVLQQTSANYTNWSVWTHANTAGNYTADFSGDGPFTGDFLRLQVDFVDYATGNQTIYYSAVAP